MGLSVIAAGMDRNSAGHFYAPVSFLILVVGTAMVVRGALAELKGERQGRGRPWDGSGGGPGHVE